MFMLLVHGCGNQKDEITRDGTRSHCERADKGTIPVRDLVVTEPRRRRPGERTSVMTTDLLSSSCPEMKPSRPLRSHRGVRTPEPPERTATSAALSAAHTQLAAGKQSPNPFVCHRFISAGLLASAPVLLSGLALVVSSLAKAL
ncbi:unnamed protein product [Pleuronectes platessa]|uniref:Uncharacterized protein n=1 Tax=Pleuronectes platessa TaxID=8262 RepID=A0A9N7TSS9_PLEPL|nr:unnamed protein product [Pleuronectes platessa]